MFFGLSPTELVALGVIAVLLFGSKLPEVAKSLGGSYREFRRTLNDMQQQFREVQREVTRAIDEPSAKVKSLGASQDDEDDDEPSAPKFTPPT